MRPIAKHKDAKSLGNGTNLGFELKFWQEAGALQNYRDAENHRFAHRGLICLMHISDALEAKTAERETEPENVADPEDPEERVNGRFFWQFATTSVRTLATVHSIALNTTYKTART
jgi:hypothetical protein